MAENGRATIRPAEMAKVLRTGNANAVARAIIDHTNGEHIANMTATHGQGGLLAEAKEMAGL